MTLTSKSRGMHHRRANMRPGREPRRQGATREMCRALSLAAKLEVLDNAICKIQTNRRGMR
jgi:hypothetical protein